MVIEPKINDFKVAHLLIDGGSTLGVVFTDALDTLQIPRSAATPIGQIQQKVAY